MVLGHLATALIPFAIHKKAPILLFLFAAQFLDFLMLFLVFFGVETFETIDKSKFGFDNIATQMMYSHDLLPAILWAILLGGVVWIVTKNKIWAFWAGALVVIHELSDLLSGFYHNVYGEGSPVIGLGLYAVSPPTGLIIEIIFTAAIILFFFWKTDYTYSPKRKFLLATIFILPTVIYLLAQIYLS